jgi:hypothetical protein
VCISSPLKLPKDVSFSKRRNSGGKFRQCSSRYSEAIKVLYQANTFICLDHRVLADLCHGSTSSCTSLVRSLHFHFHANQYPATVSVSERRMFRSWDDQTFGSVSKAFHEAFPNLQTISIFHQGRFLEQSKYKNLLGHSSSDYQHPVNAHIMALEPPKSYFVRNDTYPSFAQSMAFKMLMDSRCRTCNIINDIWRVGRLRLRPDDEPKEVLTLDYAVLIHEDETEFVVRRDEPPLLWELSRMTQSHAG